MQDKLRQELISTISPLLKQAELITLNKIDLSEDGVRLTPIGHRQVADKVLGRLKNPS